MLKSSVSPIVIGGGGGGGGGGTEAVTIGSGRAMGFGVVSEAVTEPEGDLEDDTLRGCGHSHDLPLSLQVEQTGCWPSHLVFVRWHGTQACATRVGGADGPWSTICLRRVSLVVDGENRQPSFSGLIHLRLWYAATRIRHRK